MVRAYKSLTKEKEALDASLKVLLPQKQLPPLPSPFQSPSHNKAEDSRSTDEASCGTDVGQATPTKGVGPEAELKQGDGVEGGVGGATTEGQGAAAVLMHQVETLTRTLSTLAEERGKLEMSYQKDKKVLLVRLGTHMCCYVDMLRCYTCVRVYVYIWICAVMWICWDVTHVYVCTCIHVYGYVLLCGYVGMLHMCT